MDERILQQILSEIQNVKSKLEENTRITKAIHNKQEETDAKLDSLALDVHKIRSELASIKGELEFTYQKTSKNELEIFKLRRERP